MGCGQLHAVAVGQVRSPLAALLLSCLDNVKLAVHALRAAASLLLSIAIIRAGLHEFTHRVGLCSAAVFMRTSA